jgi:hypothetical protein
MLLHFGEHQKLTLSHVVHFGVHQEQCNRQNKTCATRQFATLFASIRLILVSINQFSLLYQNDDRYQQDGIHAVEIPVTWD